MGLLSTGWLNSSSLLVFSPELFPSPVLKALPSSEPQEGGSVTLSCQTKLSLQRSASRLLFSFYKDGRPLSIRGVSSELQIPKASEEHSGSYWCEAATEDRQVWKQSPQLEIRVQGELVCMCDCGVYMKHDWVQRIPEEEDKEGMQERWGNNPKSLMMEESTERGCLPQTVGCTKPRPGLALCVAPYRIQDSHVI